MRSFHTWHRHAAAPALLLASALTAGCMDDVKITAPNLTGQFPEHPGIEAPSGASVGSGVGIHEIARGSGHLPIEGPQKIRVFTFEAAKRLDGSVSGSFELRRAPGGVRISGDVACLELIPGNEAWIGGLVRDVTDPGIDFIVGWAAVFHVRDAGDGPGAGPDQITLIQFFEDPAVATDFCEQRDGIEGYELGLMDIAAGSVQVGRVGRADIVYAGERGLTAMNADGSGQSVVHFFGAYPEWSPDGKRIAVHDGDIWVVNADGTGGLDFIVTGPSVDLHPAWSPDGRRIAFNSDRDGDHEIYLIDPDGENLVQITDNEGPGDERPAWSPDGKRVAFDRDEDIWTMKVDGTDQVQLTFGETRESDAAWSPDGKRIAFSGTGTNGADDPEDFEIWVMNADGSGFVQLTENGSLDMIPTWSPDGKWIAFMSDRDGDSDIYVMRPDGSEVTQLTFNDGPDGEPNWRR